MNKCNHCGLVVNDVCTNHRRKDGSYPIESLSQDQSLSNYIAELEARLVASYKMNQGFTDLEAARADVTDDLLEEIIDRLKEIYLR